MRTHSGPGKVTVVTCGALMYVICYCVCDKTRTCSVLIKETFHCSSLRHRSYLINDGLNAWGVIHYCSFGGKRGGWREFLFAHTVHNMQS